MASIQIPNLTAAITLTGAEQIEVVQAGSSVRSTTGAVATLARIRTAYAYNALPTAVLGLAIMVTGTGQTGFGTQLDGATAGVGTVPAYSDGSSWFIG